MRSIWTTNELTKSQKDLLNNLKTRELVQFDEGMRSILAYSDNNFERVNIRTVMGLKDKGYKIDWEIK